MGNQESDDGNDWEPAKERKEGDIPGSGEEEGNVKEDIGKEKENENIQWFLKKKCFDVLKVIDHVDFFSLFFTDIARSYAHAEEDE